MKKSLFLFYTFFTQNVFAYSKNYGETFINTFFATLIFSGIFYLFIFVIEKLLKQTIRSGRYVKNEVKAKYKTNKIIQEKYRKYLELCDKQGKRPLNYKQWKFVYISKNKQKKSIIAIIVILIPITSFSYQVPTYRNTAQQGQIYYGAYPKAKTKMGRIVDAYYHSKYTHQAQNALNKKDYEYAMKKARTMGMEHDNESINNFMDLWVENGVGITIIGMLIAIIIFMIANQTVEKNKSMHAKGRKQYYSYFDDDDD